MMNVCIRHMVVISMLVAGAQTWAEGDAPKKNKHKDKHAMFAQRDANADGQLSAEEYYANAPAHKKERMEKRFKAMDANSDGLISKDEFSAFHQDHKKSKKAKQQDAAQE